MLKKIAANLLNSIILLTLLVSCVGLPDVLGNKVEILIAYGSEKEAWMEPLVAQFNESHTKTSNGDTIVVTAQAIGSIESARLIVDETLQPTVWSPASSIYIPIANTEWKKNHTEDLIPEKVNDLVLSPVVIAMWKPMAEALGWPEKQIGWADISALSTSEEGWAAYGYPEWGNFKFGHTNPGYSNSGIVSIIAETYAGSNKTRGLTTQDLQNPDLETFMHDVESSVIHYGESTGFFARRMFEGGPSYLSAAVMYENLIVDQQTKVLNNQSYQIDIVAIYPKEGTFWSNHPYIPLNAPWVTEEQKEAASIFEAFLLDPVQQETAMAYGFRPADPSISLRAPLDKQHGVDISQPQTILEVPSAEVIQGIEGLWQKTKKPVDLVILLDVSSSMSGEKINAARTSLNQFIGQLYENDRLQIINFGSDLLTLTPLTEIGPKREDIQRRVSGIVEGGDTRLYDAIETAYQEILDNGDPQHIQAIVVLSDGQDTASNNSIDEILSIIGNDSEKGGNSIKLFTVGYGNNADFSTLENLAESTGGKSYQSDPSTINEVYKEIATFF